MLIQHYRERDFKKTDFIFDDDYYERVSKIRKVLIKKEYKVSPIITNDNGDALFFLARTTLDNINRISNNTHFKVFIPLS